MTDLRQVRRATVFKQGVPAATLARTDSGTRFSYLPDYPGPAVATTLPLTDAPEERPGGAVPPFFAGLLPEGRRLSNVRRALKASPDDELSLLLAVGADLIGDVQVLPEGTDPHEPAPLVHHGKDFSDVSFHELLAESGIVDPVGIAGVQDKVSARMLSVPIASATERYILKLDPPEFADVVRNEEYFLSIARRLRHPVTRARVVLDRDERPGLLVTRFDRVSENGTMRRLAVEDALQLLGRYPAEKYSVSSEEVARAVGRVCAARPVALRAVFQQFVLAWLTGNGDLHAKNISVLRDGNEWRVSPIYDVPSGLFYGDRTAALPMQGRLENLVRARFLDFAGDIGLPVRAAETAIAEVLAVTETVPDDLRAGALPLTDRVVRDACRSLERRRRDMLPPQK
ncbi:MAG: type II toxin-antitoxin system HipA family toxin [Propionibacterium sp.]|nr:type II toxin-antitoxin system HipA family toxin [Propionibacterium sp.]